MSQNETTLNGRPPRKQLSEQLDRLDAILDALDAGLGEVVADAVKKAAAEVAQQTAENVTREKLTNTAATGAQAGQSAAPSFLIKRARLACLSLWRHRLAAGASLSAGLASLAVSYLVGPAASSLALAACGAAAGATLACRPLSSPAKLAS